MISERQTALDLISLQADQLAAEGYSVFREPPPSSLPSALKDLRPDAIAIGVKPFLFLEVVRPGSKSSERVARIKAALEGTDWKLRIILDTTVQSDRPQAASVADISEVLESMRTVLDVEPRAALLLGWAAMEALARNVDADRFAKAQSPGRVVEMLASMGYIVHSEAEELRSLAGLRNQFIHGGLSISIPSARIEAFVEIIESLAKATKPPRAA